jgi:hypothetical protein
LRRLGNWGPFTGRHGKSGLFGLMSNRWGDLDETWWAGGGQGGKKLDSGLGAKSAPQGPRSIKWQFKYRIE